MKERPILFNGAMVRALLDGTKTQTRRLVKAKHIFWVENSVVNFLEGRWKQRPLPYGQPSDLLWVRETWAFHPDFPQSTCRAIYRADRGAEHDAAKWKPSIHMPRWASRINLEIVSVRVERLNEISEEDAMAEGCERLNEEDTGFIYRDSGNPDFKVCRACGGSRLHNALGGSGGVIYDVDCTECSTYVKRFRNLWTSVNGAGSWDAGSWDANPWVWVVEFRRVQ